VAERGADNASTDATAEIARRLSRELPGVACERMESKGRGRALHTNGGGRPPDSRIGAKEVMAVAAAAGKRVGSVSGLYDLQGKAGELRASG
jgi:hypothetical protein